MSVHGDLLTLYSWCSVVGVGVPVDRLSQCRSPLDCAQHVDPFVSHHRWPTLVMLRDVCILTLMCVALLTRVDADATPAGPAINTLTVPTVPWSDDVTPRITYARVHDSTLLLTPCCG
jgi:hypothetical protein